MLQAEVGHRVAERGQEVILAVVLALVQRSRFAHQAAEVLHAGRRQIEILRAIRNDVEEVPGRYLRRQRNLLEILTCKHWRIHQPLQAHRLEGGGVGQSFAGRRAGPVQGRAELPRGGQRDRGRYTHIGGIRPLRIDHHRVPTQHGQVLVGRGACRESTGSRGGQEVELDRQDAAARRNGQVEGVHVELVTLPLHGGVAGLCARLPIRAAGGDDQAGQVFDWACGRVFPGNPLRIHQGQRSGCDGHRLRGMDDLARGAGQVYMERYFIRLRTLCRGGRNRNRQHTAGKYSWNQ